MSDRPATRPARSAQRIDVWDILINDEQEVLIALDARAEEAANARVFAHGAQGLILARNARDAVFLEPVPARLMRQVLEQPQVLVAETDATGIVRDYIAQVVQRP